MSSNDGLTDFEKYRYSPSLGAAILFTILFTFTTSTHLLQLVRFRTLFMIPFFTGGALEVTGYIGRMISATESAPYALIPYIIQTIAILVAPALLAASIYMLLARIAIAHKVEDRLPIRNTWLTKIFVAGDVLSFLMQAGGGGILGSANTQNTINTGENLIVGGLFVQIGFFGLFLVVVGIFHCRIQIGRNKQLESLYIVSILIFTRSIVRVVEYLQGYKGYIISHEAFLYIFDGTLMFFAMVVMNVTHPAKLQRKPSGGAVEIKPLSNGEVGLDET